MKDTNDLEVIINNQRLIMQYLLAEGRLTSLVSRPEGDGRILLDMKDRLDCLDERASKRFGG